MGSSSEKTDPMPATPSFRNREQFGRQPDEADSGAEYVVARYCTPARIRSQIRTMVLEDGREFGLHLNEDLYPRVVDDMWAENWQELMRLDVAFTPADVYRRSRPSASGLGPEGEGRKPR